MMYRHIRTLVGIMFITALFFGITIVAMAQDFTLTLSPSEATNPVGTTHTVIAELNKPLPGQVIKFVVIDGPNKGTIGFENTDISGHATFTYTDTGGSGSDQIQAFVTIKRDHGEETFSSNVVTKDWVVIEGFMTGGGSIGNSIVNGAETRVTHGFELQCNIFKSPNNLEVNWNGNKFHLENLTSTTCFNDSISPNPPKAGFDRITGTGIGRYNGVEGAKASWRFTDAGEPGQDDKATIFIADANGNTVLVVSGKLDKGNQQAHK